MIKVLSENGIEKYGICHFVIDTPSDLNNLSTKVEMGSTCFVISTSDVYMLNSNHQWKKIQASGGGGDTPVTPTIGFVPTEWNENGLITKGTWYGSTVSNYACSYYTSLTDITFNEGDNITSIGANAFRGCTALNLDSLPSNVTTIGNQAFQGCTALDLEALPSGVITIGTSAFDSCPGLTLAQIPATVTTIGSQGFYNCTSLVSITFEGTPTSIANNTFIGCSNLLVINVPWAEGSVANAPWGAINATINYNYIPS